MALALQIFERLGWEFLARWAHVLAGITWIGLLYYFNFVQVPSFAQMEAAARNNAIDKLASRALWWFRWAAFATFAFGIMLLILLPPGTLTERATRSSTATTSSPPKASSIATGMLLGITMFLNVWGVIWPNQKKVIANARNVQAGGEPDPAAAAAGRKAALASRMNTIFSLPMLFFMIGAAHFFPFDTTPDRAIYWVITLVIWAVLELSALGVIGGFAVGNITNWMFEDHRRSIGVGLGARRLLVHDLGDHLLAGAVAVAPARPRSIDDARLRPGVVRSGRQRPRRVAIRARWSCAVPKSCAPDFTRRT